MRDDPLGAWLREGDGAPRRPEDAPARRRLEDLDLGVDDLDDDRDRPPRPLRLWLLATAPWLAVVVLVVALVVRDPGDVDASPSGAPPAPTPAPPVDAPPTTGAAEGAARAAAVLAVRAAVSDQDPSATVRYVDLATAEAVQQVGDVAVVTVAAVVLEGDGGRWRRARPARFAVPVRVAAGAATLLGEPWALPAAPLEQHEPAWAPADGPEPESVAEAVAAAGYREVTDVGLSRSEALPGVVRAELSAVGPGDTEARRHRLWLTAADPPSVLGGPRSPPATAAPSPLPTAAAAPSPPAPAAAGPEPRTEHR